MKVLKHDSHITPLHNKMISALKRITYLRLSIDNIQVSFSS